jgi:Flp pilus assembly protein TadD
MASRPSDEDLGVEVVIEADVQPAGTVDLRALPARGLGSARRAAPSAAVSRPLPAPAPEPATGDDDDQGRASTAIDAAIARDALARAKRAAAASTRVDESAIYPAPEPAVPPSGFPPAPALPQLEESADIAAVEAAAEAPIPPRPAAASSKEPARYIPREAQEELIPDLGEPSAAGSVVRLVAWLLFLTLLVVGLYAHLMGAAPWQTTTLAAKPPAPTTPATEAAAPTTATVLTPVTERPAVTEAPAPVTEAPVEKGPTPEEALAALRSAAQGAAIGADVGAEPEYSGKVEAVQLANAEQLRADAARLIGAGSLAEAAKVLEELVGLLPDDAEARFKLGLVRHRQGDFTAAEASYRAAAERAPNDPRPLNNLGLVLSARGDPTGAKGAFERALSLAPEHPDVLANLGGLVERDSPQGAHPLYDKALGVAPNHGPARIGRARVRMALGDRDGAASDFSSLVEQGGPLAVRGLDGLGLVARDAGKAADAEACFRRALEREPTDLGRV